MYLAALNKSGRRWGTWPTVGFLSLAAAFLCHPYPAVFIGAASLLLLPRVGWSQLRRKGPLLVAGLTAWWWLPFITQIEMAYLDMARWPTAWDAILMSWTVRQLASGAGDMSPALLALYVAGGAAVLVSAASGAYRLARTVPDRRVLYPFIAMMALPLVNRLASTLNIGDEVAEFVGFQGGRMFFIWWIAVPALAVYAVVVVARDTIPKLRTARPSTFAAVVSLSLVSAAALLVLTVTGVTGLRTANTAARYNIPPSAVDARTETSTWYAATVFVTNGPTRFYALSTDTGRNVRGLHRESSPTARFASAMPLPEWIHISYGQSQLYDPNVPFPSATRTLWPFPQLQTFGADGMWEPPATKPDNLRTPVGSGFTLLDVPPPPDTWPLDWIPPAATTYRGFLEHSLQTFGSWDSTEDVTIPVWGTPPEQAHKHIAATADVDWSDDRFVRFYADHGGLYYAPASWHPNWTLTTAGAGPWPAGPNQMVVWADTPGLVELTWGKHWSESAGQAVSALTSLVLVVGSLPATRLRRPQETGAGGSGPLLPLNKAPRKAGHP